MLLRSKDDRAQAYELFPILGERRKQHGRAAVGRRAADAQPRAGAGEPARRVRRRRADARARAARGRRDHGRAPAAPRPRVRRSSSSRRRRTRCWRSPTPSRSWSSGRLVWMGPCDQTRRGTPRRDLPGDGDMTAPRRALGDRQHRAARALRGVLQHPDLELVGLLRALARQGRDGRRRARRARDATGVIATNDVDALLAHRRRLPLLPGRRHRAAGGGRGRGDEPVPAGRAQRGVDVAEPAREPEDRGRPSCAVPLEEACRDGGTSFFNNGADPGFGSDLIPLTLLWR